MSNVTPINGGGTDESPPTKCQYFHLAEPDNTPSILRLIQALRGVCWAIEQLAASDNSMSLELGTAADILSEMLQDRVVT